ncbi:cell division protein ZapA [Sphingomonas sp. KC8]|uniref:cell division protein ZapA n=1 Tax=Sphingomonas sp. KC8 TaxID=1030157 RepID=UPI0002488B5A|nr:cell division protein ZapA [Sphingomonas sp. KC8]ARS26509.1 hypothetical protein KC8_04280 [Sphingomonas sp. KC8]
MPEIDLEIGGRRYALACRDGEEAHFHHLAAMIDAKMSRATKAVGGLNEVRQFLFASLLLADELDEASRTARIAPPQPEPAPAPAPAESAEPIADPVILAALERLAERLEAFAGRMDGGLEGARANA